MTTEEDKPKTFKEKMQAVDQLREQQDNEAQWNELTRQIKDFNDARPERDAVMELAKRGITQEILVDEVRTNMGLRPLHPKPRPIGALEEKVRREMFGPRRDKK